MSALCVTCQDYVDGKCPIYPPRPSAGTIACKDIKHIKRMSMPEVLLTIRNKAQAILTSDHLDIGRRSLCQEIIELTIIAQNSNNAIVEEVRQFLIYGGGIDFDDE